MYFHVEIQTRQEPLIDSGRISAEHVFSARFFPVKSDLAWNFLRRRKNERGKRQVCIRQETLQQIPNLNSPK